jgi:hypothetical protein
MSVDPVTHDVRPALPNAFDVTLARLCVTVSTRSAGVQNKHVAF